MASVYSSLMAFIFGSITLQGPHHVVAKSTTTRESPASYDKPDEETQTTEGPKTRARVRPEPQRRDAAGRTLTASSKAPSEPMSFMAFSAEHRFRETLRAAPQSRKPHPRARTALPRAPRNDGLDGAGMRTSGAHYRACSPASTPASTREGAARAPACRRSRRRPVKEPSSTARQGDH